jgi:hypothetical protein
MVSAFSPFLAFASHTTGNKKPERAAYENLAGGLLALSCRVALPPGGSVTAGRISSGGTPLQHQTQHYSYANIPDCPVIFEFETARSYPDKLRTERRNASESQTEFRRASASRVCLRALVFCVCVCVYVL